MYARYHAGASVGYVQATRTSLPRTVRTRGAGRLGLRIVAYCTCGVRVPASAVPYVPRTVRAQVG